MCAGEGRLLNLSEKLGPAFRNMGSARFLVVC